MEVVQRPVRERSWAGGTFTKGKGHHSLSPSAGQFIILVIDSTDRDRLLTTREELYKMLAHEVSPCNWERAKYTSCVTSA